MASGYISGKKNVTGSVNIPYKNIYYTGVETDTASVSVDNDRRTISVDVNVESVTKNCATKEYVDDADALKENISNKVTYLSQSSTDTEYPSALAVYDVVNFGSNKELVLELLSGTKYQLNDGSNKKGYFLHNIRIKLINFTEDDIGGKIYLYRKSRTSNIGAGKKKGYFHPLNWNVDDSHANVRRFGYGVLANTEQRGGGHNVVFTRPDVPDWMPHDGYIPTEFTLTEQDISKGYININTENDWLCLLTLHEDDNWTAHDDPDFDVNKLRVIGDIQNIKFGFVKQDTLIAMSSQEIVVSSGRLDLGYKDNLVISLNSNYYLNNSFGDNKYFTMKIK